jgi:hypothetical protein
MNMSTFIDLLEGEFEEAFQVKDKKSLHRTVLLLSENLVEKRDYASEQADLKSDVKIIAEKMGEGFARMDIRFEALQKQIDQRFEAVQNQMDQRFGAVQIQMDQRFEASQKQMGQRFDGVNRNHEDLQKQMNSRFNTNVTLMAIGFVVITVLMSLYNFF